MEFARHCSCSYSGNKDIFNLYPENEIHKEEILISTGTMCEMVPVEFIWIISSNTLSPIKNITFSVVIRMKTSWKNGPQSGN